MTEITCCDTLSELVLADCQDLCDGMILRSIVAKIVLNFQGDASCMSALILRTNPRIKTRYHALRNPCDAGIPQNIFLGISKRI